MMNWKLIFVAIILVASFTFAIENDTVDLKVTKVVPNPRHLYPGTEDVSLMVTLINTGTKTLQKVETTLDMPSDFEKSFSGSDEYYAGTLMPNVPAMLQYDFNIDADTDAGEECFDIEIDSEDESFTEEICLEVEPKPEVEIKKKSIPTMVGGQEAQVSITVKNIGEEDAQDVKVKLLIQSAMPFSIRENLQELGSLDEGESAVAVFEVLTDTDALAKEYKVEVQLRYTSEAKNDENVYVTTENIEFDVTGSQGMTGAFTVLASPWFAVIFGVIVVGAFLFIMNIKKK